MTEWLSAMQVCGCYSSVAEVSILPGYGAVH